MVSNLPRTTKLYKLLNKCDTAHAISLRECADGAFIFECSDCPFVHNLDNVEEAAVRKNMSVLMVE
jgi:Zn-finger protein